MAAGKGPRPRPWPLGPQTARGGPPPVPAPPPLPRESAALKNLWPLASSATIRLPRTAGLWSHTGRGGALRVGQHLPPTAGPGAGGAARPGHSSPSSQSIGAGTLRRLHPRACCSHGDCGSDEGQGESPGLQVLAPRGWPLLSRLGQCLPHAQRGEHSAPAPAEAGAHSRGFIGTSFQDGVP